jgi:hypothetical protein
MNGPVDGAVSATFRLFDAAQNGNEAWSEVHDLDADGGLVLAELGSAGSALDATIFDGSPLWLEVEIGGEILAPRSPVGSVPYAIRSAEASHAAQADQAAQADNSDAMGGIAASGWQQRVTGTCPAGSSIRVIASNGTTTCEPDDNTTYVNGSGLNLNGSTFSIQPGGVTSSHIANGTITGVDLASSTFGMGIEKKSNNTIGLKTPTTHVVSTNTSANVTSKVFCAIMSAFEPASCFVNALATPGSFVLQSAANSCVFVCIPM